MKAQNKDGVSGRGSGSPCAGPPGPEHPAAVPRGAAAGGKGCAGAWAQLAQDAGGRGQCEQSRDRGDVWGEAQRDLVEDAIPQTGTRAEGGKGILNSPALGSGASPNLLQRRRAVLPAFAGPEAPDVPAVIVMTVILAVIGISRLDEGHRENTSFH